MKKIALLIALMAAAYPLAAQTLEEIVQQHVNAIGSAEKLKKLKTVFMEGSVNMMGNEVGVKIYREHNKGMRQTLMLSGMESYTLLTPEAGWNYLPMAGQAEPKAMTKEEVVNGIDELDLTGFLYDYQAKGHEVTLLGKETVSGSECYKLQVMRKNSGPITLYLDAETFLLVRTAQATEMMGQRVDMVSDFGDYRDVNGYKFPFSVGQQYGAMNFKTIRVNEKLPKDVFVKK